MVFIIYYAPDENVTEELINRINTVLQQECDSEEFHWGLFVKEDADNPEIFAVGIHGRQENP